MNKCKECRFWEEIRVRAGGRCRRYPPTFIDEGTKRGHWPETSSDDWCGEFKFKDTSSER